MKYFVDIDAKTFLMLKIGGEVKVLFGRGGRWGGDVCVGGMCRDHVQQGSCVGVIRGFV